MTLTPMTRVAAAMMLSTSLILSGCASTHTLMSKKDLVVSSEMSETIFLTPVAPEKRIAYVEVRNTTDKRNLQIEPFVHQALRGRGIQITDNPEKAQYLVQANILSVGQMDLKATQSILGQGYDGAVTGALLGATIFDTTGHRDAGLLGVVVGSAVGQAADAFVKDINFTVVTDIQVSERTGENIVVKEINKSNLSQGANSKRQTSSTETTEWKRYQTRIVTHANKANLSYDEAERPIIDGLTNVIAGLI